MPCSNGFLGQQLLGFKVLQLNSPNRRIQKAKKIKKEHHPSLYLIDFEAVFAGRPVTLEPHSITFFAVNYFSGKYFGRSIDFDLLYVPASPRPSQAFTEGCDTLVIGNTFKHLETHPN